MGKEHPLVFDVKKDEEIRVGEMRVLAPRGFDMKT